MVFAGVPTGTGGGLQIASGPLTTQGGNLLFPAKFVILFDEGGISCNVLSPGQTKGFSNSDVTLSSDGRTISFSRGMNGVSFLEFG